MLSGELGITLGIFILTVILVIWRPAGIHETIPALTGAGILFILGIVKVADVLYVSTIVRNAALTIVSTFIMSSILDRAGLFRWAAINIAVKTEGSGKRLFIYSLLLSLMLTLFLNNDGSILIGTPIILELCRQLKLTSKASFAILMSSAMIGTISSAPIGVSNLANLEAMTILNFTLISHAEYMFLASVLGILTCSLSLYMVFRKELPKTLDINHFVQQLDALRAMGPHPVPPGPGPRNVPPPPHLGPPPPGPRHLPLPLAYDWWLIRTGVAIVVLTRVAFFIGAYYQIPVYIIAVAGASILLLANSSRNGLGAVTVIREAPWHVLLFAFGMELTVWGLRNVGLTTLLGKILEAGIYHKGGFLLPGAMVALLANGMNNHPALIVATLTLRGMDLPYILLRLSYTASVLGSDVGSLITPIGTLASLMWFHLTRQKQFQFQWSDYMRVSLKVVPLSFAASLLGLYIWSFLL